MITYETTQKQLKSQLKMMKKQSFMYSMMRISAFVLALLFIWIGQYGMIMYLIAALFISLFLLLVYVHNKFKENMLTKQTKLEVIEKLNARKSSRWKEGVFECISEDRVLNDLDITGKSSLLEYISMAQTPYGKDYLISIFQSQEDMETVQKRQNAIKELLKYPEVILNIQTDSAVFAKHSKKIKREVFNQLVEHAKETAAISTMMKSIPVIASVITLGLCTSALFWTFLIDYIWICISINLIFVFAFFPRNHQVLKEVAVVKDILIDYERMMKNFDLLKLDQPYLKQLQTQNKQGLAGIHQLLNIAQLTQARSNFITNLCFNGLFLLDFHCVRLLKKWKNSYGSSISTWFQTIAQVEALSSLCVIAQVKETYCFPEFIDKTTPVLNFKRSYHPLISEKEAIANHMDIANETYIITGSNMSGKTTFLRTIGINSKLAFAGAPVCAKEYVTSFFDVYTSMRIQDDVNEGISTFYAELLSIKTMMDHSKLQKPMLVLIDEIFKGTNSADRITCAKEAISRLHQPWITTMVSTHDFELCSLDSDEAIHAHNYHFEESYLGDEIQFDYTLKKGKCTTTNAKALMRLAGF